jgi:hypothetical protein
MDEQPRRAQFAGNKLSFSDENWLKHDGADDWGFNPAKPIVLVIEKKATATSQPHHVLKSLG